MTTTSSHQEQPDLTQASFSKVIDSGVSDQSHSTLVSLGKRDPQQHTFEVPQVQKRLKKTDT